MTTVGLTSAHGSPGTTTTAVALAAAWPQHRRCLLIEADPFGGLIAARYGLGDTPGLSSLAADSRKGLDQETLWQHVQHLPGGVAVLVGPATADEARVVLRDLSGGLSAWSSGDGELDVIVDCGRLTAGSPALGLAGPGARVLVLARPTVDQLRPAVHRIEAMIGSGVDAALVLIGDTPYGPAEVEAAMRTRVDGVVAWDPRTAAVLTGARGAVRDLRRSPLVRSIAALAERLAPPPASRPDPALNGAATADAPPSEQPEEVRS